MKLGEIVASYKEKYREKKDISRSQFIAFLDNRLETSEITQDQYEQVCSSLDSGDLKKVIASTPFLESLNLTIVLKANIVFLSYLALSDNDLSWLEVGALSIVFDRCIKVGISYPVLKVIGVTNAGAIALLKAVPGFGIPAIAYSSKENPGFIKNYSVYKYRSIQEKISHILNRG